MKIQILCDNSSSWMVPYAKDIVKELEDNDYDAKLIFSDSDIVVGEILFLLSCEKIFKLLYLNKHNLVIHSSALPKGKGWSPLTWQILQEKKSIPVTLFEASEKVDAGQIYYQTSFELDGTELVNELREKQAIAIKELIFKFLKNYPEIVPIPQQGEESFYQKRKPEHSRLDINKTIAEQFNLLRVSDNDRYPAYFEKDGIKYILKVYKAGK